jgi:hypothetical protein
MKVKRTERGWGGHFIGCRDCQFRLNTLLECGDKRVVVSTIGRYYPPVLDRYVEPGHGRHFETMAFHAEFDGQFWDANVCKEISFESNWCLPDVTMENEANEMHETAVRELSSKLVENTLDTVEV